MQASAASGARPNPPSGGSDRRGGDEGTALRERTTAVLAFLVAIVTLGLLVATFWASSTRAFDDKKNVLLVGLPLLGTVLGYYFGRVPAEKRADQAQQSAQASQQAQGEAVQQVGALSQQNERFRDQIGAAANAIDKLTDVVPDPGAAIRVARDPAEDKADSLANAVAGLQAVRDNVLSKSALATPSNGETTPETR